MYIYNWIYDRIFEYGRVYDRTFPQLLFCQTLSVKHVVLSNIVNIVLSKFVEIMSYTSFKRFDENACIQGQSLQESSTGDLRFEAFEPTVVNE